MIIGIPTEIKALENRVSCTPAGVGELVHHGHTVWVQKGAGLGSGFTDEAYSAAGAILLDSAQEVWSADIVYKVKEPLAEEYKFFREDLVLFTYLHLAAEAPLTAALVEAGTTGIAYETVQASNGSLPLLTPMSEVAGRMSVEFGSHFLKKAYGGKGVLLGGVPGVRPATVTILGGGVAGINAAKIAVGSGARVIILDINADRLRYLDDVFGSQVETFMSNRGNIAEAVAESDLLVGAVLIPGAAAPKLVTEAMVESMTDGSVIVDIAIDQGGCIETIDHVTYHDNPTYIRHGVVHYSVGNMPGAVPRTSTMALSNVTLPYALKLADLGPVEAMKRDPALKLGMNTRHGKVTHPAVATSLDYEYVEPDTLF